jgi:hypothetical protein
MTSGREEHDVARRHLAWREGSRVDHRDPDWLLGRGCRFPPWPVGHADRVGIPSYGEPTWRWSEACRIEWLDGEGNRPLPPSERKCVLGDTQDYLTVRIIDQDR